MYIHNCCTGNDDRFALLIKTANAHTEKILPQTTVNTF